MRDRKGQSEAEGEMEGEGEGEAAREREGGREGEGLRRGAPAFSFFCFNRHQAPFRSALKSKLMLGRPDLPADFQGWKSMGPWAAGCTGPFSDAQSLLVYEAAASSPP